LHTYLMIWQRNHVLSIREYGYIGPYDAVGNVVDLDLPADIAPYRAGGAGYFGFQKNTS